VDVVVEVEVEDVDAPAAPGTVVVVGTEVVVEPPEASPDRSATVVLVVLRGLVVDVVPEGLVVVVGAVVVVVGAVVVVVGAVVVVVVVSIVDPWISTLSMYT
jgi:hypothetical protein